MKRSDRIKELFALTHEGVQHPLVMRNLRGSMKSRVLLIAPPSKEGDYALGLPFSDNTAQGFHEYLAVETGFSTEADCLIVSASVYAPKPGKTYANKASTLPIIAFIRSCVKRNFFDKYICVGGDAFQHIFGEGRKTTMETLAGSTIFVRDTGHKPLFVFPNIYRLNPIPTGDTRNDFFMQKLHWEQIRHLQRSLNSFKTFLAR